MKKLLFVFVLTFGMFMLFAASSQAALSVPTVNQGLGTIGASYVFDNGLWVDWNYGISPQLGVKIEVGFEEMYDLGIKYELQPNFAITGGVFGGGGSTEIYAGVIGSALLADNLLGIAEVSAIFASDFVIHYELGIRHNIDRRLSIYGGLWGFTSDSYGDVEAQIGVSYAY